MGNAATPPALFDRVMIARTAIERAFQLAATGQYLTVTEIRLALQHERWPWIDQHLAGGGIRKQLKGVIAQARPPVT